MVAVLFLRKGGMASEKTSGYWSNLLYCIVITDHLSFG